MRSCQGRLVWILLAVAVLLLIVAVAAVAIYLILQQPPPASAGWQDPIAAIVPDEIAPDLALYPLAGAAELDTVDAAIANGDLETAYALLVFGLDLSDAQRIGRLVLLGGRFAEVEKPERASQSFRQVYETAVLSPHVSDPARADALLSSGKGWAALGQEAAAAAAYEQVYLIAVQSPYLQMANRRDLLAALEAAYLDLGRTERASAMRTKIIELDQQLAPKPPSRPGPVPSLPSGEGMVSSPDVGALEENRRQAAFALLQVLSVGADPSAELVDGLAQALRAEDAAKLDLYRRELEATTQPSRRIDIQWQMIRWLMLKYQVAARGFGLSLVPEWEAQLADIQSTLSKAYEELFFDYEDLVTALPDASLIGPGSYQVRRQVILDGRLGRYPNHPLQQLVDKLKDAARGLIASGLVEQLYVDAGVEEGETVFFLSPANNYGQPAQSP